jgi:beta-mannosidase
MRIIFLFVIVLLAGRENLSAKTLQGPWRFRQAGKARWYPARVPGTVHTDLLRNGLIPDPFLGTEEEKQRWVSAARWEYACDFAKPNLRPGMPCYLVFRGVDTYAEIVLNDQPLLKTDNMFQEYRVEVSALLRTKNTLRAVFHPADSVANVLAARAAPLKRPCENNRHYVRKAQYHFGWDWAPALLPCGFWQAVELEVGQRGEQAPAARYSPVRLVQEEDSIGRSFYFTVNGKPTYMKGANWVPADVFLPRLNRERYRSLLVAAKEANINMLRVWGGGIYESDDFYSLCDSLGIYVWQDFMFAGAMYPFGDPEFLASVEEEVRQQVKRLRKHPCIVLWCGNNEISEAWHNWGWQKQFGLPARDSAFLWQEYVRFFEQNLPALLRELDPGRDYISGSPLHGWGRAESRRFGDSHYWGVWWGQYPLDTLRRVVPRFMSEFGMQAMPDMATIKAFAPSTADRDTALAVMRRHQKHPTGFATLARYLAMEGLTARNFPEFAEATQELQARTLRTGIQAQMFSGGRCMGTLIWQFNDCWPVCSWSVVDYYGRKKKGWYALRSLYAQQADGEK